MSDISASDDLATHRRAIQRAMPGACQCGGPLFGDGDQCSACDALARRRRTKDHLDRWAVQARPVPVETVTGDRKSQVEFVLAHGWVRTGSSGSRFRHRKSGQLGSLQTALNQLAQQGITGGDR